MEAVNLQSNIVHIKMKTRYEIASMFMRLQEYYESPMEEIRMKYFTVEQYMDAYAEKYDNFTYFSDWSGFNVPGNVVANFFQVFLPEVTIKEARLYGTLLPYINKFLYQGDKFYVIGTYRDTDVSHEVAHALFYLNDEYQREMSSLVDGLSAFEREYLKQRLLEMGYTELVVVDEIQAYLATSGDAYWQEWFKKDIPARKIFEKTFQCYWAEE